LPPGILSVYYPDKNWNFHVRNEFIGPPSKRSCDIRFEIAGGDSDDRPGWGSFYFIAQKVSELPSSAKFAANQLNQKILNELLRNTSRIVRNGTKLLRFGGAFYIVTVYMGSRAYTLNFCGNGDNRRVEDSCLPQNEIGGEWSQEIKKVYDALKRKTGILLE